MIALRLSEIAALTGGTLHGEDVTVTGPAFVDSRLVEPGGLFVAVVGEHVDGHQYAAGAVAAGAAAVLGSRPTDVPTVVVDDPVTALGLLARHVRDALPALTVLALTGSSGKTGTKDYLVQLLAAHGETVGTAGNFNNELGVPLTVLRATEHSRYLVVEMGARGLGHISYLCGIARPDVAAVINVGTAHIGEFGSQEAIARAKGEILEGLAESGTAVLNADDPLVAAMADRTAAHVALFGALPPAPAVDPSTVDKYERSHFSGEGPSVSFRDVKDDDLGRPAATFTLGGAEARIQLLEIGHHQVLNAAAAASMALAAGVPAATVATALATARSLSRWRMEVHDRSDGATVINDAYNANPGSMHAALDALASIGRRSGRRTVAVLGEMRELGAGSDEAHREVGEYAARPGVDVLLVVGEAAEPMAAGARDVTSWSGSVVSTDDRDAALAWLRQNVTGGDVVLVKASRGAALELVAMSLLEETDR